MQEIPKIMAKEGHLLTHGQASNYRLEKFAQETIHHSWIED